MICEEWRKLLDEAFNMQIRNAARQLPMYTRSLEACCLAAMELQAHHCCVTAGCCAVFVNGQRAPETIAVVQMLCCICGDSCCLQQNSMQSFSSPSNVLQKGQSCGPW